jgi:hypothetical protein
LFLPCRLLLLRGEIAFPLIQLIRFKSGVSFALRKQRFLPRGFAAGNLAGSLAFFQLTPFLRQLTLSFLKRLPFFGNRAFFVPGGFFLALGLALRLFSLALFQISHTLTLRDAAVVFSLHSFYHVVVRNLRCVNGTQSAGKQWYQQECSARPFLILQGQARGIRIQVVNNGFLEPS